MVSKLHPSDDDDDADGNDDFRSAPGAALPENGLVRLFISERERERNRKKKIVPDVQIPKSEKKMVQSTYRILIALSCASHPKQ